MIKIEIMNQDKTIRTGTFGFEEAMVPMAGEGELSAFIASVDLEYNQGDFIRVTTDAPGKHLVVKLDETLDSSLIYLKETSWEYVIPLDEGARKSIPPAAFVGKKRNLSVRYAKNYEVNRYRNLALNTHDQKEASGAYPHASANVETRNDSTFYAKNAIDGVRTNNSHGPYPYQSWGINRDPNAKLKIDFGREVCVDSVCFTFRADFPHDSYWTQVSLGFSDGSSFDFMTEKTADGQIFNFAPIVTSYVVFENLIKADDESPFPALTQIEVYGAEIN